MNLFSATHRSYLLPFILLSPLFAAPVHAEYSPEQLEKCLDKVSFQYSAFNKNLRADTKIYKDGCIMKFIIFAGKGEKRMVNLCSGDITIQVYPSIESEEARTLHAGSSNCAKPLFGADFDSAEGEGQVFKENKERIMEVFNGIRKLYGVDGIALDPEFNSSASQFGCTGLLLKDYLENCIATEENPALKKPVKKEEPKDPAVLPAGVHPSTIKPKLKS